MQLLNSYGKLDSGQVRRFFWRVNNRERKYPYQRQSMPVTLALYRGFLLILWIAIIAAHGAQANVKSPDTLVIPDTSEAFRVPQSYFTGLLRKALIKGADGRPVPLLLEQPVFEQGRATTELIRGRLIDVYWMGTNLQREAELRAIPIPLTRGLVGFRRFIIHRDKLEAFDKVKTLADLKTLKACQGMDWPDTTIMRAAGLSVRELANIETAYKHVARGTCDYFPRGYFEIDYELAERMADYPDLVIYPELVLHYPFAVYFFVSKDNEALATWIERGLERMIDSGELMTFMAHHPLMAHTFPLVRPNLRIISISNPEMEGRTEYKNPRYWFQSSDFAPTKKPHQSLPR